MPKNTSDKIIAVFLAGDFGGGELLCGKTIILSMLSKDYFGKLIPYCVCGLLLPLKLPISTFARNSQART
jgi:hypothetical protein